jgi:hypothetical protein
MNSTSKSAASQFFNVRYSRTVYRLELALQLLVLICIVQIIDWPYVLLFVLLFLLLGWQLFYKQSINNPYFNGCQIQILDNPKTINWLVGEGECSYSGQEIKILMTRWFILLQLGQGKTKTKQLLLADSFDSYESYLNCRKLLLRLNYAS